MILVLFLFVSKKRIKLNWYMMECHLVPWMPADRERMIRSKICTYYVWLNRFGIERKKNWTIEEEEWGEITKLRSLWSGTHRNFTIPTRREMS